MFAEIYGSEYSGCDGWHSWLKTTLEVIPREGETVAQCKVRAEKEIDEKYSSTYVRTTVKWLESLPQLE
jgi:hypothetical protein